MFHYCWLIDASSLEFLDLSALEFHEKSNTTLLSALDLCVPPRRYSYFPINADLSAFSIMSKKNIDRSSRNFSLISNPNTDVAVSPNMKLIKIFTLMEHEDSILNAVTSCFFRSFTRNTLERLAANFEPETVRLYLKQVKTFSHCIETSLFPASFDYVPNIITFEKPRLNYKSSLRSQFMKMIMKKIAPKLIKLLLDKLCTDSALVVSVLDAVCFPYMNTADLFFECGAEQMKYLFHHLKKVNYCNFVQILKDLQKASNYDLFIRSNPEHLLVLLNCGVQIAYHPIVELQDFHAFAFQEDAETPNSRRISTFPRSRAMALTPRQAFIFEVLGVIVNCSVPLFTLYLASLRLISRSIPDALISYKELRHLLLRYTDIKSANNICDELRKREFDSFDIIHQPRTLLHYSRYVLRKALMLNLQLPEGIELLRLPDRLKSYMRLEF